MMMGLAPEATKVPVTGKPSLQESNGSNGRHQFQALSSKNHQ
jgi:hypothetical protein